MANKTVIESLLKNVMRIEVLRMNGASSGILGMYGSDFDVVTRLKRNTISFARECKEDEVDHIVLGELVDQIDGDLQILQLSHTISNKTADEIIGQLQAAYAKY